MQFNITFKTIFEFILTKVVLCIQIRFVSTEKTTRIASRASCYILVRCEQYNDCHQSFSGLFSATKAAYVQYGFLIPKLKGSSYSAA